MNNNCYQYDVATNTWTTLLTTNFNHIYSTGIVYQNNLYIFDKNGWNPEAFDLASVTAVQGLTVPTPRGEGACAVQVEDSVLVLGGKSVRFDNLLKSERAELSSSINLFRYEAYALTGLVSGLGKPVL